MIRITYFVVVPFICNHDGDLLAIEAEEAPYKRECLYRSMTTVGSVCGADQIVGAIALSRTGDPQTGKFDADVILARHGETPDTIEDMRWQAD